MVDVSIIGAGVAGLCLATEITARGGNVAIYDREPQIGEHACSWWAGGMLAPFCEGESAEEPVVRHGQTAAAWWEKHTSSVTRNGSLVLALGRDTSELTRFSRRTSGMETVNADVIDTLEPDLSGRFSKGLFFKSEAHLSPRDALAQLTKNLQSNGVAVQTDMPDTTPNRIDCRGLSAKDALQDLRGVKGEMLILRCPDITLSRPIRLLHPRIPIYIVPRGDGVFMLGATMIESQDRNRITARSMLELLSAAYALLPAFGEAEILEIGVDARPAFPDNLPRIQQRDGVIYANGLYRHGFLLAPALAQMTADYLFTGNKPEFWHEN
ncbi:thiamine biosynthesis protein thio [Amylibacter kogurei]|uniref:Thiamine biosynthesis protein thio n=1 Tax=Paramylibacter kogurei TaxID=1889778 RepID=A0A2G5K9M8_9RHOB|nr:FAD-dependent oxidoreductase [Amylibacter kogurei]PIB25859.1 thiamine biosynthesis protein thio [Amylibacter kogurei]